MSDFPVDFERRQITIDGDKTSIERRVTQIWKVLQETNNNLNACDQLLEYYSHRAQFDGKISQEDVATQTTLSSQTSSTQTSVLQLVHEEIQTVPSCELSVTHATTQTTPRRNEFSNAGIQTCIPQDSATQTRAQQEMKSLGSQTETQISYKDNETTGRELHLLQNGQHYNELRICTVCQLQEFEENYRNETTQTVDSTTTKELQEYQKITDYFSNLEQHFQDVDSRLGSVLSVLEMLVGDIKSSAARVFKWWEENKDKEAKVEDVLEIEKQRRQRAEELLSVVQSNSGLAVQETHMLNRRLMQLEEMLTIERMNVVKLQESRARLSAQMKEIKCSLVDEQVIRNLTSRQATRLKQEKIRLRARLSRSHVQYRAQLADARRELGSRNTKVKRLRAALIKVRDLCHSVDNSYRAMLWEIGKQVQLTAELMARDCGLSMLEEPMITTLTAADISDWYQQIWRTAKWIQLHVLSHQREEPPTSVHEEHRTGADTEELTPQQTIDEQCSSLSRVKVDSYDLQVDGRNTRLSLDLSHVELSPDISSPMQPTIKDRTGSFNVVSSTTCSSLSQDLSWQHIPQEERFQMQHRFIKILDNLKEKLLQIRSFPVNEESSNK
ncbi:cingulin-like protein 1 [Periplaneta americana]|uniref:cingulin-like protein 1 n=1 Tax=Periplaneta americana TaxID=6978 RepID=UPI0037E88646